MTNTLDDIFPEDEQSEGRKHTLARTAKQGRSLFSEVIVDLSTNYLDMLREIERACEVEGRIDQKFLYLDPIAVKKWKGLIECDDYKTYRDCSSALRKFLSSQVWKDAINNGLNTIVDLGVGAGQKDNNILRSFLQLTKYKKSVSFVLVDTSFPMIETTLEQLRPEITRHSNVVKVVALRTDFLNLKHSSQHYLNETSKSAYFVLGCTFCNVREEMIMLSISGVARPGDLLVLGLELYDEHKKDESLDEIKSSYDHQSLRELAVIPLKMVLDRKESDEDLRQKICVEISEHRSFSDVPKAATIVIRASIPDEVDVVLASSSRYDRAEVIRYVENFGYLFKGSHASNSNRLYEHLVFEYK